MIDIADSYGYITRTLFLTAWYASIAPLGAFISLIGILINYWVDKIKLLRFQSAPETISVKIISTVINNLELLPLVYICGNVEYKNHIERVKN